jgi:hypothetical protein
MHLTGHYAKLIPGNNEKSVPMIELRGNAQNLWVPIAFAAAVSEAVPMSSLLHLPESLQQMSSQLLAFGIKESSIAGVFVLTIAFFPVSETLVVPAAFGAFLGITRSFSLRGFLCGLVATLLVLGLGYAGVMAFLAFSVLHLPQPIFYYVVLRLPIFFALVLALRVAHSNREWLKK